MRRTADSPMLPHVVERRAAKAKQRQENQAAWRSRANPTKALEWIDGMIEEAKPEPFDASGLDPESVVENSASAEWAKGFFGEQALTHNQKIAKYGVEQICDDICEGLSFKAIAQKIDVNPGTLLRWCAHPDRKADVDAARVIAARAYDDMALEVLMAAGTFIELGKAREIASHYRWRAKSVAPREYGERQQIDLDAKVTLSAEQQQAKLVALTERIRKQIGITPEN